LSSPAPVPLLEGWIPAANTCVSADGGTSSVTKGAAYQIGRAAVRAVAAEFDGFGQKTQLTPVLFGRLGVNSPHELMAKYYSGQWSRDHLAGLAGWVHEAAEGGDLVAQTVLREAGRELAELALAVISLLFPFEKSQESTKDSEAPIVIIHRRGIPQSVGAFRHAGSPARETASS
jgi:hypothetical protein